MKYCDLFSGCGGVSAGFQRVPNMKCVLAVDNDEHAELVYRKNFPRHRFLSHDLLHPLPDAKQLANELKEGMLIGGCPCQDFSTANHRQAKHKGQHAELTAAFAAHIDTLRPKWVVFENVPSVARRQQFQTLVHSMQSTGYQIEHRVLCMTDFGMSQKRHRLILLAVRGRDAMLKLRSAWMAIEHCKTNSRPKTVREVFVGRGLPCPSLYYYYPSPSGLKSVFSVHEWAPTIRGRTRPLPNTYKFQPTDASHDRDHIFNLSTAHLAALQGFPNTFTFLEGRKTVHNNRLVGNAAPPPLSSMIASAISSPVASMLKT